MSMKSLKSRITNKFLNNYIDIPKGAGKIIPLIFIESFAMSMAYFISAFLVNSLHFSSFQVGKLIATMSLGTGIGSLISGYLTIRISATRVSSLGFFLYGLGLLALTQITSFYYLIIVLFICGMGGVFMMIANLTALIRTADNETSKNRLIVLQSVIFNGSYSIFAFLISYSKKEGMLNIFAFLGSLLLIASLLVFHMKDEPSIIKIKEKKSLTVNVYLLKILLPSIFCYGFLFSLIKVYFAVETISRFSPLYSGIILSMNPYLVVFVQPLLMGNLIKINNTHLLAIGGFLLGMGYFLFGLSSLFVPCLLFVAIATIGEMIFSPISKNLASTILGNGNEGLGLALWKTTYYLSGILGAYFVGYVGERYNHFNIWNICILLSFIMVLFALAPKREINKAYLCKLT